MPSSTPQAPELQGLAPWSPWLPFTPETVASAPRSPGVYLIANENGLVYIGQAGERSGTGLRGRLTLYVSGRAPHSGLGNLALERALQDPAWLSLRLKDLEAGVLLTVQQWSRLAIERAALSAAWATTATNAESQALEQAALNALVGHQLWNRRR